MTDTPRRRFLAALALGALLPALVAVAQPARKPAPQPAAQRTVLVMGDSLSAAYGLAAPQGWVALTEQRMRREAPGWRVVNASISGETSAGGASRIAAELQRHKPAVVVIELGANDGLRGLPLPQIRANLTRMVVAAKQARAKVLLVGIKLPPNYGPDYTQKFAATFSEVAKSTGSALLPFLLDGFASDPQQFLPDGIHPVAAAQPRIVDNVWAPLRSLLGKPLARR